MLELLLLEEVHVRLGCRGLTRCNALEVCGEDLNKTSLVVRGMEGQYSITTHPHEVITGRG